MRISDKENSLVPLENGVLSYNNEFRTDVVPPENFVKRDWDIFLTILLFCQNKKLQKGSKLSLSFDDLAEFLSDNILKKVKKRFYNEVVEFAKKATLIVYRNEFYNDDGCEISGHLFFDKVKVSRTTEKITFWFSDKALEYLNYLENFTNLSLKEWCALRGVPAKMIYRVLIQHQNNSKIINEDGLKVLGFSKMEFIKIIMPSLIGKSDNEVLERLSKIGSVSCFDRQYIKPAIDELNKGYFDYVDYKKVNNPASKTSRKEQKYYLLFDDKNRK